VQPKVNDEPSRRRSNSADFRPRAASESTLEVGRGISGRLGHRGTTVRWGFIQTPRSDDDRTPRKPPLAQLISASKGGAMRTRLYLALLWTMGGGDERHMVNWPARTFAELLDLKDPHRLGERRVREAFRLFERLELLTINAQPGRPSILRLQREDGSGETYTNPGDESRSVDWIFERLPPEHYFVELPSTFWTQGWHVALDGPALAMLLVLLRITNNGMKKGEFVSPRQRARYRLSDDTWSRGVSQLQAYGIVTVKKKPVGEVWDFKRLRNTFTVERERLDRSPLTDEEESPARAKARPRSRPKPKAKRATRPTTRDTNPTPDASAKAREVYKRLAAASARRRTPR